MLLYSLAKLEPGTTNPDVATDLSGNVTWYYAGGAGTTLTRPLVGTFLVIQKGTAWNRASNGQQILNQIDLAGNVIRQTNTGAVQQQLLALGAVDGGPCNVIPQPAPIGSACLGAFHHDAIQSLPNGYTAVLTDIEKIFPPGTQGDKTGLPVDIMGDMIVVLDNNFQVVWYFDTFDHDTGPPQLDISRAAVLGETCTNGQGGCPPLFLLGSGIATRAHDWLHANSLYYWPMDQSGVAGQIIWSSRHQDWVMKVDYENGNGSGNILWRMGPESDFTFNNIYSDPWPWFSHQHEVGVENLGAGPMTLFDNGNTRLSAPPLGLGSNCKPNDCHSRGMALTFDENTMQVTPVMSQDLGYVASAKGSAQLLSNGNYFFMPAIVVVDVKTTVSYVQEFLPTAGTDTGTEVLNVQSAEGYRAWQMLSWYAPPIT
jgi:arylsulfate sulfotransferase